VVVGVRLGENLDRHQPIGNPVAGPPDHRHATPADPVEQFVTAAEDISLRQLLPGWSPSIRRQTHGHDLEHEPSPAFVDGPEVPF
jgi:hypothetical protein